MTQKQDFISFSLSLSLIFECHRNIDPHYVCTSNISILLKVIQVINRNFTFHSAVDVGAEQIIVQMKQFEFGGIRFRLVIRLMGLEKLHV